ncbi:MAG: pseudouridine-5-phosphate glycosidase [Tenericutes bacterium GWF2_57_13]|nr:MAG: pseudouridine-5-phosphate glycosidase [Tenericutes bacterium GWF2_57_13]
MTPYLRVKPEVAAALAIGRPVVALESTIISHGMPWPENKKTALACETVIRQKGAVPATVAVIDGILCVGLEEHELDRIAKDPHDVIKTSRRDLPYVLSQKQTGALTVAATMVACALAGIRIFATGGIGGVHRGWEHSLDISADLEEFAKTSVCVVAAGAKAILDLPATMEYLETKGVPVVGYGVSELPAFYTRTSGLPVDCNLADPEAVALFLKAKWDLGLEGGVLVANPVPKEYEYDPSAIDAAIAAALSEMNLRKIRGKEQTPFLLKRIGELTGGKSLTTNIALVLNNCAVAADIAVAYARLGR